MHLNKRLLARSPVAVLTAAMALASAPGLASVKEGVDAWSAGDYARAVAEWRGPAANGDADALFNLAQAYRLGRGVEADIARARELYAEAARQGHVKAADNYGLLLFQQGEQEDAMPLIRNAADRGDPRAQYVLGLAHFNADYADKDWVRAYALLTLARSQGLPQATEALAQMDRYVPEMQRQEAQALARRLEMESIRRRAAELAAADLGGTDPGARPVLMAQSSAALPAPSSASPDFGPASGDAMRPIATSERAPAAQQAAVRVAAPPEKLPERMAASANPRGEWRVQLGAFGVHGNAERLWSKISDNPALAGTDRALVPAGRLMQLQAVGFGSRSDARAACLALRREGQACIVAAPPS